LARNWLVGWPGRNWACTVLPTSDLCCLPDHPKNSAVDETNSAAQILCSTEADLLMITTILYKEKLEKYR
jgi:hypothetical protein